MLEYVIGIKANRTAVESLLEVIRRLELDEGTFYVGYPVLTTPEETIAFDALLCSKAHGLVVFDLLSARSGQLDGAAWSEIETHQQRLYTSLTSKLLLHPGLVEKRQLAVPIEVLTYAPLRFIPPAGVELQPTYPENLQEVLAACRGIPHEDRYRALNAAIQRVTTIKPRKRRQNVKTTTSRGAVIREIEREIANLDRWQKRGAIEAPDGPQRIRGLAGSGKTVVLALKAAYLHARHPDWRIAITFQTRSLYQQFRDFVRRFSYEHTGDEPDWTQLRVLHAWGTAREPGLYSEVAQHANVSPKDFNAAKAQFGRDHAFQGVCAEVEAALAKNSVNPLYDAILIDEAQDFPIPFFRMCFAITRPPKRIVWAYDELQNLSVYSMPPPSLLFGEDREGRPLVELKNEAWGPHQDVILPVCYRNTPWALVTAHSLGFGIYRDGGFVQLFDDPGLWADIGYQVVHGTLTPGNRVELRRAVDSYPAFFEQLLDPTDAVRCVRSDDDKDQARWVAEQIQKNITDDELEPSDILVIFTDPITVSDRAGPLLRELWARNINAHIAGVTSSRDQFFVEGSVTITGIYRAKGNEAPMVYVLDSQYCYSGYELIRKRNTLFTAITRSRAWVRICGYGDAMRELEGELGRVTANNYHLSFNVPTSDELQQLRRIHRDMTTEERQRLRKAKDSAEQLLEQLEAGDLSLDHLPEEVRQRLRRLFAPEGDKG